jgi:hypothetical protein
MTGKIEESGALAYYPLLRGRPLHHRNGYSDRRRLDREIARPARTWFSVPGTCGAYVGHRVTGCLAPQL